MTTETVRREVVIRGVTHRLTSTFAGLKDLDATVKRLAVKHATQRKDIGNNQHDD